MPSKLSLLSLLLFILNSSLGQGRPILYGDDDRVEISEEKIKYPVQKAKHSVALVLEESDISSTPSKRYKKIKAEIFGEAMNLCQEERFYEQLTAGFCTGFLVSEDILVTAGHCLPEKNACTNLSFLFDFHHNPGLSKNSLRAANTNLFSCKEVLYFSDNTDETPHIDVAIIRLDRPATGRARLVLATHSKLPNPTKLSLIGHPSGLALKVAHSGSILENSEEQFFSLAIDSYSANSGSPAINEDTGEVEGMLIRGHEDFVWKRDCYVSAKCTNASCSGEDALRSLFIQKILSDFF